MHSKFYGVKHSNVGGVTTHVGRFLLYKCPAVTLKSTVRRSVGSVIEHKRYIPSTDNPEGAIHTSDLLPINNVNSIVRLPSRFTPSGFATRVLAASEICAAFDFPSWCIPTNKPIQSTFVSGAFPLKTLITISDLLLDFIAVRGSRVGSTPLASLPDSTSDPRGAWISHYGKGIGWMPLSWIDSSLVTDKAVKTDKASVPIHLWDKRVSLLLNVDASKALPIIRNFINTCVGKGLIKSFCAYMLKSYGSKWWSWLENKHNRVKYHWLVSRQYKLHRGGLGAEVNKPVKTKEMSPEHSFETKENSLGLKDSCARQLLSSNISGLDVTEKKLSGLVGTSTSTKISLKENKIFKEIEKDVLVGSQAIQQYRNGSWWAWEAGSGLLFWRWPTKQSRLAARDGFPVYVSGRLPRFKRKQSHLKEGVAQQLAVKIGDVRKKRYIVPLATTLSDVDYFPVPKGIDSNGDWLDIRVVYNGTSCGLNEAMWAPSFWLPSANTAIRQLCFGFWSVDIDLGEMFLNFPLPSWLHKYLGVRMEGISVHLDEMKNQHKVKTSEAWTRCLMGFGPSPYLAIRFYYHAEEFIIGKPRDNKSALRWDKVVLNCPGNKEFDPRLPWVYKWDDIRKSVAGAIVTFVDDGRASGKDSEHAWQVSQQTAKRLQFLGIQNAPRKIRPPAQVKTGAWSGTIVEASINSVFKTIAGAKWARVLPIVRRIIKEILTSKDGKLDFKQLEKDRGFLVHIAMTFITINPYLKGMHQSIDSWRPNRNDDGWKMKARDYIDLLASIKDDEVRDRMINSHHKGHPDRVDYVQRLLSDMYTLEKFFNREEPTKVNMRAKSCHHVIYGVGDASGDGFGDSFLTKDGLSYHIGIWNDEVSNQSSNYREFRNFLVAFRREGEAGRLRDSFVIFCTDNTTVETALYKGTSDSPLLLEMVIEFHTMLMEFGCQAFISHVAGTRMIAQGGDGLSRGALNEGVMRGDDFLSFIPFHLSAIEREQKLIKWVCDLTKGENYHTIFLTPDDWFERGHDIDGWAIGLDAMWRPIIKSGTFVWTPPPAACDVALEELRKARIKRHDSTHLILVPRLMTPRWLKQLYKCCDLIVEIPPCCEYWPSHMYEPVFLGICFPYLSHAPWQLRGTPKLHQLRRTLQGMWKNDQVSASALLRKFLLDSRRFSSMPEQLVCNLLYFLPRVTIPQGEGSKGNASGSGGKCKVEEKESGSQGI